MSELSCSSLRKGDVPNPKHEIPGPDLMCKALVPRALHWKHYSITVSFHGDRARAGRNPKWFDHLDKLGIFNKLTTLRDLEGQYQNSNDKNGCFDLRIPWILNIRHSNSFQFFP
jgi:hypothetical protein